MKRIVILSLLVCLVEVKAPNGLRSGFKSVVAEVKGLPKKFAENRALNKEAKQAVKNGDLASKQTISNPVISGVKGFLNTAGLRKSSEAQKIVPKKQESVVKVKNQIVTKEHQDQAVEDAPFAYLFDHSGIEGTPVVQPALAPRASLSKPAALSRQSTMVVENQNAVTSVHGPALNNGEHEIASHSNAVSSVTPHAEFSIVPPPPPLPPSSSLPVPIKAPASNTVTSVLKQPQPSSSAQGGTVSVSPVVKEQSFKAESSSQQATQEPASFSVPKIANIKNFWEGLAKNTREEAMKKKVISSMQSSKSQVAETASQKLPVVYENVSKEKASISHENKLGV